MATKIVNIGKANANDSHYRYKMPQLQIKGEGRGNGVKTVLPNIVEVARSLSRPPTYPTKYFGCELGAQTIFDEKAERYIVNGSHDAPRLRELLDNFIDKFVLCAACKNPETDLIITKDEMVIRDCKACGERSPVDMRHKLVTFILKNPPKKPKKKRTEEKEGSDTNHDEAEASGDDEMSRKIAAGAKDMSKVDIVDADAVDWSADTSKEAMAARMEALNSGIQSAILGDEDEEGSGPYDAYRKWLTDNKATASPSDIYKKAVEMGIEKKHKTIQALVEGLFDENVVDQVSQYTPVFLKLADDMDTEKSQKSLLGGIERLLGVIHPDLIAQAPKVLMACQFTLIDLKQGARTLMLFLGAVYQAEILEEEFALNWGKHVSKKYVPKEVSKQVRLAAKPFIKWLEEANDSDEEEPDTELSATCHITKPLPRLFSLTPSEDLRIEHSLSKNANLSHWQSYLSKVLDDASADVLAARGTASDHQLDLLGGLLATNAGRKNYARLVDLFERALQEFSSSYKLWRQYLEWRKQFILGTPVKGKSVKLSAPKKKRVELDGHEGEKLLILLQEDSTNQTDQGDVDFDSDWVGGLDGIVGAQEWKALAGAYERALICLPKMPRIWIDYLTLFTHPKCPAFLRYSHARKTFDRALRSLTGSLHARIWRLYLSHAVRLGGEYLTSIWQRYLAVDQTLTEYFIRLLLNQHQADASASALRAAKLLLQLFFQTRKSTYKSPEGSSALHLLVQFLAAAERFPDEIGLDLEDVHPTSGSSLDSETTRERAPQLGSDINGDDRPAMSAAVDELERIVESSSPDSKLDVERFVRQAGIALHPDQAGKLYVGLATFWVKKGEFEHARDIFEEGVRKVLTIRDFTTVFDAYAEFAESYISGLMETVASGDADADDEAEVDRQMQQFEDLMDRRPFLVNEVLLRRNPHDVQEWEKRIVLWGSDDDKVNETYEMAVTTINPRKAVGNLHQLYLSWAKFFENGGASQEAEPDLASARKVFEKAVQTPFKRVDDLATIWCEWAQTEVRAEEFDEALRVMAKATVVPKKTNISFHDESHTSQARLFKSLKLWSFRADLEESLGSVESTKAVYDKIFELKIANAQMVVNYANFLEENQYFEESFKVFERGLELFTYPIRFELLNTYIAKFLERYKDGNKIERARELFEDAISQVPSKFAKSVFMMYAQMEEEYGLAKRAMKVYDRAIEKVDKADQFETFEILIAKTASNFGLPATRSVYQRALETLPDAEVAEMCLRFAALERKLGEIDRARSIYAHGSQFCDPRVNPEYWSTWHAFELESGSEDTFREYLRIKRSVGARYNTEASYVRAAATSKRGTAMPEADESISASQGAMEALESRPMFVAAQRQSAMARPPLEEATKSGDASNADEIQIEDE